MMRLTHAATTRTLLVPAAQGRFRLFDSLASEIEVDSGDTAVFGDCYETEHDVMESLSLRRDLRNPGNPPFGLWWTYTVEETLLLPILNFKGNVNLSLDVVMLGAPGGDDSDSEDAAADGDDDGDEMASQDFMASNNRRVGTYASIGSVQNPTRGEFRGLDDGNVIPELIDSFLKNVHVKYLFLEATQLRTQAANAIENGIGWDTASCKVLLACALGAISSPWDSDTIYDYTTREPSAERFAVAQEYFLAAQKRLGPLYASSSLEAARCLFMAGMYYISRSMESRLYWSSFMAEREVACEFGMETSGLNVIAYLTSLPSPPSGQVYTTGQAGEASQDTAPTIQDERSWYFFLTHIMLRKVEVRIDTYTQAKRREAYRRAGEPPEDFFRGLYEANFEFDYQLIRYYESLPPSLRFSLDDTTPCADELCHYLKWRVHDVRHDICEPSFYALLNYDVSHWSSKLVDGLITHANTMLRLDIALLWAAGSTHRAANTWLALRKGVRAGLILIAARRLKAQARRELMGLQVPDDESCLRAAQALVRGLKHWASESRDCLSNLDMLRNLHSDFRDQ
ncbi:uncharacterized protein FTJAE_9309 [Fusarium tjaetaba]|uniref:Transcription factor domain-containing protein n=1 Tax=Fusarium tjaetaba TaxID=1567544 RepID=A0A8H5R623_9HYPO|nr:uncharacterized protein FTJAE_9309 [Fusarium tjaetaba]KAF5627224.1 hypothetical protein FTJAE_9309 [Fusarium tjaetaba]